MLAERATEVEASRGRLITAADEERRRLERDLHDGAQQHLVALAVLIQLARTAEDDNTSRCSPRPPSYSRPRSPRSAGSPTAFTRRSLVSGGLAQACRRSPRTPRSPFNRPAGPRPLPRSDRGRAVFLLQRGAAERHQTRRPRHQRHDHRRCRRRTVVLTVSDTGGGFDPAIIGTGLTNMTDRVSAIGGDLVIDTTPGRGTRVTAVVETASPAQG